ncbi:hypothetical protein KFF05_09975 [bacterium SCSIO 12827]|nr:hypothetical protein KFF05_09975 [bacterium SCSIO 12827]
MSRTPRKPPQGEPEAGGAPQTPPLEQAPAVSNPSNYIERLKNSWIYAVVFVGTGCVAATYSVTSTMFGKEAELTNTKYETKIQGLTEDLANVRKRYEMRLFEQDNQKFINVGAMYGAPLKFTKTPKVDLYDDSAFFALKSHVRFRYEKMWPFETESLKTKKALSPENRKGMEDYYLRNPNNRKAHVWLFDETWDLDGHEYLKQLRPYIIVDYVPSPERSLMSLEDAERLSTVGPAAPMQEDQASCPQVQATLEGIAGVMANTEALAASLGQLAKKFFDGDRLGYFLINVLYGRLMHSMENHLPFEIVKMQKVPGAMYLQVRTKLEKVTVDGKRYPTYYIHETLLAVQAPTGIRRIQTFAPSNTKYLTHVPYIHHVNEWLEHFYIITEGG